MYWLPGIRHVSLVFEASERQTLPQGYMNPSAPRQAFSHSASLGKRLPAQAQYSVASCQETPTTGLLASPVGYFPLVQ
jgi:hypothetical protein